VLVWFNEVTGWEVWVLFFFFSGCCFVLPYFPGTFFLTFLFKIIFAVSFVLFASSRASDNWGSFFVCVRLPVDVLLFLFFGPKLWFFFRTTVSAVCFPVIWV